MATKNRETIIVVEGTRSFPLDMLRYDKCHPLTEQDVSAMSLDGDKRRVVLRSYSPALVFASAPTYERWSSFGWTAVWHGSIEQFHKAEAQIRRAT